MNVKESIVGLNKVLNGMYRPEVFSSKGRSYVIIVMASDTLSFHSFFFSFFFLFLLFFFSFDMFRIVRRAIISFIY